MKNIKLRFNYIIWMGLFLIAIWKFDLHLLFILIFLCVAEESWWVMRMEEGEIERGIWGRIVREQPDKLGVVSLDRISAGMCQNHSMNNWKGTEKETERYRENKSGSQQKMGGRITWSSLSPISLSGLSLSSIDQIKFLLAAYSSRALWR